MGEDWKEVARKMAEHDTHLATLGNPADPRRGSIVIVERAGTPIMIVDDLTGTALDRTMMLDAITIAQSYVTNLKRALDRMDGLVVARGGEVKEVIKVERVKRALRGTEPMRQCEGLPHIPDDCAEYTFKQHKLGVEVTLVPGWTETRKTVLVTEVTAYPRVTYHDTRPGGYSAVPYKLDLDDFVEMLRKAVE